MMRWLTKKKQPIPFDPETQEPVIRASICTGERTAGFADKQTGRFHEYCCIHDEQELADFCRQTGTSPDRIRTIY